MLLWKIEKRKIFGEKSNNEISWTLCLQRSLKKQKFLCNWMQWTRMKIFFSEVQFFIHQKTNFLLTIIPEKTFEEIFSIKEMFLSQITWPLRITFIPIDLFNPRTSASQTNNSYQQLQNSFFFVSFINKLVSVLPQIRRVFQENVFIEIFCHSSVKYFCFFGSHNWSKLIRNEICNVSMVL